MKHTKAIFATGAGALALAAAAFFVAPNLSYVKGDPLEPPKEPPSEVQKEAVKHLPTPSPAHAIYMTQCAVGTPSLRNSLVELIDRTELNAVVIDIKDYTGKLAFTPDDASLKASVSDACRANDMKVFIEKLHEKNIYVIGRITVFQDPYYAKAHPELAVKRLSDKTVVWKDHKGLSFIDVNAKPFWEYIVKISKASYDIGFDELNYDYIRFPSDGNMKDTYYSWGEGIPKAEALERFYKYLSEALKPSPSSASSSRKAPAERGEASERQWEPVISADLFGYTAVHLDDLGIGQLLEKALPYFDYIDPMVYPSHYNSGFAGLKNVNSDPYKVVYTSMREAVRRAMATTTPISSLAYERIGTSTPAVYTKPSYPASKIRPWLQSFDYPVPYTPAMVQAQVKANEDAGLDSYLFWDPANKYDSLRQVLKRN